MKRLAIGLILLLSLAIVPTSPAFSAVKTGVSCAKLNQVMVSAGYKYTCVKSGKKLVWSKGVTVVKP
ncbi:MAG: hypothetical protein WCO72_11265, partial [Betaproteobacteria bacterium]